MMTKHKLTAIELYVIQDALLNSLRIANFGSTTREARINVLDKIENIMSSMNVEVLTDTPEPTVISADTGI